MPVSIDRSRRTRSASARLPLGVAAKHVLRLGFPVAHQPGRHVAAVPGRAPLSGLGRDQPHPSGDGGDIVGAASAQAAAGGAGYS
jgi:hypothetical protein